MQVIHIWKTVPEVQFGEDPMMKDRKIMMEKFAHGILYSLDSGFPNGVHEYHNVP